MNILYSRQIAEAESKAISTLGIPEIILMENAASAVFAVINGSSDVCKKAAVICGIGNNGGDGFALARKMISQGINTTVFYIDQQAKFTKSTALNFAILKNMDAVLKPLTAPYCFDGYDIIIDALFGTGLKRPLAGEFAQIIQTANASGGFKLAIDLPSGLQADKGSIEGVAFMADATVTFSSMKICHSLYPARSLCGNITVANITIPKEFLDDISEITYLDKSTLPVLKKRNRDTHKGDYGRAVIIGGSAGKSGAVYLAALSALKIGAGLVTVAYPADYGREVFAATPELMTFPINCGEYFTERSADGVIRFINDNKITVVSIGNGIGTAKETKAFVKEIINGTDAFIIIDADGINALEESDLKNVSSRVAITPHLGEFARLTGKNIEEIKNNRIALAKEFAAKYDIILVLKSAETIIASPNSNIFISCFGTAALAKGGSGDCLAGIITGLISQGYAPSDAIKLSCYILGRSGEIGAAQNHEMTLLARDVINNFSAAINEI